MGEKINPEEITEQQLIDIFLVGDPRYSLSESKELYDFFVSEALTLEKEQILKTSSVDEDSIYGPQKLAKSTTLELLKLKGLDFAGYEQDIGYGRVDVLAKNKNGEIIAIECGPCRISKAINYFKINNLIQLWLIQVYYDEQVLYIIQKGPNWNQKINEYETKFEEQLRKIKSPLDNF